MTHVIDTIKKSSNHFKFMETMLDFIFKITGRYEHIRQWFYKNKIQWEWLVDWVKEFRQPPNPMSSSNNMRLFKKRGNANYLQM